MTAAEPFVQLPLNAPGLRRNCSTTPLPRTGRPKQLFGSGPQLRATTPSQSSAAEDPAAPHCAVLDCSSLLYPHAAALARLGLGVRLTGCHDDVVTATPLPERPPTFRKMRVVAVSEHRGTELEEAYGLADGVEGSLDQFQYISAGDADVSMRGAVVDGTRTGRMRPRLEHIVFWIADGIATITTEAGDTITAIPGRPMFLSSSIVYDFDADTRKISMLHLSDRLLHRRLNSRGIYLRSPLLFDEQADDLDALRRLRETLRQSTPELVDAAVEGDTRAALNARIADAIIDTFRVRVTRNGATTPLARAVDLIHREAPTPLSLQDLVATSGMSMRGLQSAFARTYGVTPMQYLRNVRLDGARSDLEDGAATKVADIARKWQFRHLGRFARTYVERFGEQPSHTLRQRDR
ncbi:helix-turn-helix transcriptional regulator [Curtobacterium flaccumfaciens]|uniref:helix-turn-helix transcriptional regulator n=1 Tax=Curtobacterium flaccumfaciens TaxID=2035 RepID=UPI001ADBC120|nr:AraC family transcriptional regulator [Curtobacterium flaccumfaciens]MBO9038312.1 helix-turn-helix transcriptional regulator [Curtobacterium flaccumfaciens pv. flaccumfaciens]